MLNKNKAILAGILCFILALVAWRYRDTPTMRQLTGRVAESALVLPTQAESASAEAASAASAPLRKPAPPPKRIAGVRKCRVNGSIVYVDQDCPPGSRELAADGGSFTVVPSQGDSSTAATDRPAARPSTIREDLLKPGDPTLREKMIERAVGR